MWIIILVIFLLMSISFFILYGMGGGSFPWIRFYSKGKESGFSFHEINLLRKVAVENKLQNPTSLFWSIRQLDRSVRGLITKLRSQGKEEDPKSSEFLAKLFEFRKRVEFSLPKYNIGLKSTRNISPRQKLRLTLPGVGVFHASAVENTRKYLAISYPEGGALPPGFNWKGYKINVYFWRHEDAGYFFQSRVIDDFSEKKYPILYIAHTDNITRSQKRRSVRVDVNYPARVFPLKSINEADEMIEDSPGLKSRLINISEDGAAILVGGRAKVGLALKIQWEMSDAVLTLSGIIKNVSFDAKRNQSIIHIQARLPSMNVRNKILIYVYNIFNEQELNPEQSPNIV